jgi:hypothetical protein
MNLGISNTQVAVWKRIKTHHIFMAAGVALAVSALITGVSLRNDASAPGTTGVAAPASISHEAPLPQSFVYLAGSQAEADALEAAIATSSLESGDAGYKFVMVVDSAEAEGQLQTLMGELDAAGTAGSVTIVDQR